MPRMTGQKRRSKRYAGPANEETETDAGKPIKMPTFICSNVEWWVDQAQVHLGNGQPMLSFICAWIAFNHCYGLFWSNRVREWSEKRLRVTLTNLSGAAFSHDFGEYASDNVQIASFIGKQNPGFGLFWKDFVATQGTDLVQDITLPVTDLTRFEDVPDSTNRTIRLVDLELPTLFRVLLTIRNNLFHGGKKVTEGRHLDVCACAAEFMVPFVTELMDNIEGAG